MGPFTKINSLPLSIFNNAEYLAYFNAVLSFLPAPSGGGSDRPEIESLDADVQTNGSPDLGLSADFIQTFEKDVLLLADAVNESRIAQQTEQAAEHEKNRDSLVSYITTRIARAGSLPLEAERDAGKFLYKVINRISASPVCLWHRNRRRYKAC